MNHEELIRKAMQDLGRPITGIHQNTFLVPNRYWMSTPEGDKNTYEAWFEDGQMKILLVIQPASTNMLGLYEDLLVIPLGNK